MTTRYDGQLINDTVCGCDDEIVELTAAEVDQMIEAVVRGGTWDADDEMTDDEIRADVRRAIEDCAL